MSPNSTRPEHNPNRGTAKAFVRILYMDAGIIQAAGCATMGVKLLDLDDANEMAAAVTIPPEDVKAEGEDNR